jgi:o-succinylbenzoate---CoA ligase
MNLRPLTRLPVLPGPAGVAAVTAALRVRLDGGPAFQPRSATGTAPEPGASPEPDVAPDSTAVVVSTSGSTGEPLPVVIPLAALTAAGELGAAALGEAGAWLTAVPVTGIGGILTVVRSLQAGSEPTAWPGVGGAQQFSAASFLPAAHAFVTRARADGLPAYTSLVPTQLARLVQSGPGALAGLRGFRAILVGGSALPPAVAAAAASAGVAVVPTYGATETCGGVVYDGVPLPGVAVEITGPDGLIAIGGPTIAAQYLGRPGATAQRFTDGRFRSCDRGRIHEGRLAVLGRADHVIKVGGTKVALPAITSVIERDPRVLAAITVSRPDPEWGALPVSYVVAQPHRPAGGSLAEDLRAAIRVELGGASVPRSIEIVDELPLLPAGKPAFRQAP